MQPVTLKDLAARLGISPTAVSLALRNSPRISAATRDRVAAAARELGYVPALRQSWIAARARCARVSDPIPVAIVRPPGVLPGFGTFFRPLCQQELTTMGFRVTILDARRLTPERAGNILHARGIEALIMEPTGDEEFHGRFPWERFVSVGLMLSTAPWRIDAVYLDVSTAVRQGFAAARERGYRRVGFVFLREDREPPDYGAKLGTAWLCCQEAVSHDRVPPLECGMDSSAAAREWWERHRPDCLVVQIPWLAEHFPAQESGCGVLSLFNAGGSMTGWTMTSVRKQMAAEAAQYLESKLRRRQLGLPATPGLRLLRLAWHEGTSLPWRKPATTEG